MHLFISKKIFCHKCGGKLSKKNDNILVRKYCEKCGRFYYNNPLPAVAVVVRQNTGVLLVKRGIAPAKGLWALPGGFIEGAESPEKAALRELKEETGLKGKKARILGITAENTIFFGGILVIGVEVYGVSGKLKAGDDAAEAAYYEKNKIPFIPFRAHREFVKKSYGGENLSRRRE